MLEESHERRRITYDGGPLEPSMGERDVHELYLRGLMSVVDQDRYETLVSERGGVAENLARRLEAPGDWDPEMVSRAQAILAVSRAFTELLSDENGTQPLTEDLFAYPVEEPANTLLGRTATRAVNMIIVRSIVNGWRQVTIDADESDVRVYVQDGDVVKPLLTAPRSLLAPMMARLKQVARLDAHQTGAEQLAVMPVRYNDVDYRVSVRVTPQANDESAQLSFERA